MPAFKENDLVRILPSVSRKYAGLWVVVKVNPTKYKLRPEGRAGQLLNAPHSFVVAADDDAQVSGTPAGRSTVSLLLPQEDFSAGTLVTVQNQRRISPDTLFVVVKYGIDKCNIVQVGGSADGRYWRMPVGFLRRVEPSAALVPAWLEH